MVLNFLDDLVNYQDPSLPRLSTLAYLYFTCLLSAFLVSCDFQTKRKKEEVQFAGTPGLNSIGVMGCAGEGSALALLFAENGVDVALSDLGEGAADNVIDRAEKAGYRGRIEKFKGGCCFLL